MLRKYWRRWTTRFDLWSLKFVKNPHDDPETIRMLLENFKPETLGDINPYQILHASIHPPGRYVTSSCAIWRHAALDLQYGQRISNTFSEIHTNVRVSPARYLLDSKSSYIDHVAVLTESKEAMLKILQYFEQHRNSTDTDAVMNCRAIEQHLPTMYHYVTSLMTTAVSGPLRK